MLVVKTIHVRVIGTPKEVFNIRVSLRLCQNFHRLGVPFDTAMKQVAILMEREKNLAKGRKAHAKRKK